MTKPIFFPASATVLLDGKPCTSGGSNLVDREIGAGKHTLVIRDPSGKPERRQTFEVVPGETKRLGTISLSSPR